MSGRSAARLRYGATMPPAAVIAVEAAVVARNRRRDMGMRMIMEFLQLENWRENGREFSQDADGRATAS
jgi:hypothetical protein